jgi:hypothetical protein
MIVGNVNGEPSLSEESNALRKEEGNDKIIALYNSLKKTRELIDKIKSELKVYKQHDDEIEIPSINELRYVAYHTLKAINEKSEGEQDEELRRATRHSQRASYDILEIGVLDKIEYFVGFCEEYKKIDISSVIKDWSGVHNKITDINITLAEINRSEYSSVEYLEIVEEKYNEICDIVIYLDSSKDELNGKLIKSFKEIRNIVVLTLFSIVLSLVLVVRVFVLYKNPIMTFTSKFIDSFYFFLDSINNFL